MENRNIIGWILIGCTGLSSCEKADLVGMFVSHELVNERFAQSMEWNADHAYQEITVPDNTYTVYAMSDSHVGGVVNLNRFLDDAQEAEATAHARTSLAWRAVPLGKDLDHRCPAP